MSSKFPVPSSQFSPPPLPSPKMCPDTGGPMPGRERDLGQVRPAETDSFVLTRREQFVHLMDDFCTTIRAREAVSPLAAVGLVFFVVFVRFPRLPAPTHLGPEGEEKQTFGFLAR